MHERLDPLVPLCLCGVIAAWCHGWGFWAGLFWEYWLAVYIIKAIS